MAEAGSLRKFYMGSDKKWLVGESTNTLNKTSNLLEVSDKSSGWQQFISGIKGATAQVTVYTSSEAADAQHELMKSLHNGSVVDCFIGILGTGSTPSEGDVFSAYVSQCSETNDNNGVSSRTFSLTASGEVVHYPTIETT